LENDPLLFAFEDSEEEEEEEEEAIDLNKVEPTTELEKKLLSLLFKAKEDLNNLQGQFEDYKSTVKRTFYDTLTEDTKM
jgi:protein arginine N-methyltransferase 3